MGTGASEKFSCLVALDSLRRRRDWPHPPTPPARRVHVRRPARHDRRGGRASDPPLGACPRPRIWTAYGVYGGQNLAVQTLAAKVLHLDLALYRLRARRRAEDARSCGRNSPRRSTPSGTPIKSTVSSPPTISRRRSPICGIRTDCSNPSIPRPSEQTQALGAARQDDRFDRPVPAANVVCALRRRILPAGLCRGGMGGSAVLRFRPYVEGNAMSVVALIFGALATASAIYLSSSELTLFGWSVSHFAHAAPAGAGANGPGPGRGRRQPLKASVGAVRGSCFNLGERTP